MQVDWSRTEELESAPFIYAEAGLKTFPLVERGKRPLTKHGFKDATTDRRQIACWWSQWSRANVGVRIPPGVVVIDFDSQEAFDRLSTEEFELPPTVEASTGRGRHLWYRTGGQTIPRKIGLLEDVDILVRGYVVAPPSIHGATGNRYRWIVPPDYESVGPCPQWLLALLSNSQSVNDTSSPSSTETASNDWLQVLRVPVPEGRRNQTLARVAGYLFRMLRADLAAELAFCWAQQRMAPPLSDREIQKTIASIAGTELSRRKGAV